MKYLDSIESSNYMKSSKVENHKVPCFLKLRFMHECQEQDFEIIGMEFDGKPVA